MSRATNSGRPPASGSRQYESPVRTAQVAATRQRILDALLTTMGRGLTELSMPAVAAEAGVSTRTVYRHFASKAALVDALASHLFQRDELERTMLPRSVDDLEPAIRELFSRLDAADPAARAVFATRAGHEARQATIPRRLALLREGIRATRPDLDEASFDHIARVGLVLTSSASLQAWKDYLGIGADEAAREVAWAMRAVIAGAPQ